MANNFDWQTEEDFDWEELNDSQEPTPPKRRRWPYFLLIVTILVGSGYFAWRQVLQRVDENTAAMRADIISSYNLLHFAASEQDAELFISLLSGRDSSWTQAQNDLFDSNLLVDRSPFNLHAQAALPLNTTEPETAVTFDFSSDFTAAEMGSEQAYQISVGNGVTETVTLAQTGIYRLGRERWLYSPPEDDFWGDEATIEGSLLTITYPARDAEIAAKLHPDLERKLQSACQLLGSELCPSDTAVTLDFSTDPATLAATEDILQAEESPAKRDLRFILPTPSLVGLPTDDASYQALFRGYGVQMVTAVYAHLLNFDRTHAPINRAILDYQLDQLALKPWPISDKSYDRVLTEQIRLDSIAPLWRSQEWSTTGDTAFPIYILVDYLQAAYPDVTPVAMLQALRSSGDPFRWLRDLYGDQIGDRRDFVNNINRQFWLHAYQNQLLIDSSPPISFPQQDLHLLCSQPGSINSALENTLYRYDLAQESWQNEYSSIDTLLLYPMPNDEAVIIQNFESADRDLKPILWQDGAEQPLLTDPDQLSVSLGQINSTGSLLTAFIFGRDDESANIHVFDLDACDENGCATQLLPSIPIWSPDGQRSIFSEEPDSQISILQLNERTVLFDPPFFELDIRLFLGEKDELFQSDPVVEVKDLLPAGSGYAPFWLDNKTMGFLQATNTEDTTLIRKVVGEAEAPPSILVEPHDLIAALPDHVDVEAFIMQYARLHPTNPQQLFIVAINQPDQQSHLFLYDLQSEELTWLLQAGSGNHELGLAPNGRYLILAGREKSSDFSLTGSTSTLQFYDLTQAKTLPFPTITTNFPPILSFDWSADGEWVSLMLDDDIIGLYAPAHNYLKQIRVDFGNCYSPAWVN